jgi:hypothetical protein
MAMSWERAVLVLLILVLSVAYYLLAGLALRDLLRRPAVRGDNKVTWGLAIVCLPIVGALLYGYMGAASFLPRGSSQVPDAWTRVKHFLSKGPVAPDRLRHSGRRSRFRQ